MLQQVQSQIGKSPSGLTLFADPQTPGQFATDSATVYLIDPCTGAMLQSTPSSSRAFFSKLKDLHRWVAFGGAKHESLRSIKDAANLAFSFLILSGLILWIPRQWRSANLKSALLFRKRLKGRAREWNLHNIAGIWLALPLLAISLTGSIMAYDWANGLLYRAAGSAPPKPAEEKQSGPSATDLSLLDPLVKQARAQDLAWQSMLIRIPKANDKAVSFTLDDGLDSRPQERNLLTLSLKGKVTRWEPFAVQPRARQWRLYTRFLHSGELFGVVGQTIALLASLAALVLVWTGFSLSIRRLIAWRRRTVRHKANDAVLQMN